jgi:predicted dehydrogenase
MGQTTVCTPRVSRGFAAAAPARPKARPATAGAFLVAGSGSTGLRHFRNLGGLGVGRLAFLRSGQRITLEPLPDAPQEVDLARALKHPPLAVVVCNPTAAHLEVALAAARAGCHLFIEKPLSHSREGVEELVHEVRSRGLVAAVGFQYRFHPGLRQAKRWLDEGAIGEVVSARVDWGEYLPGWHPGEDWRRGYAARPDLGGGVILTLCHPFDYLHWLLGAIESVAAEVSRTDILGLDVEDTATIALRIRSGGLATVTLDYLRRPRAHRLEILGRWGRIAWSDEDGTAHLHDAGSGRVWSCPPPPAFERNTMFVDEMRQFLACLDGREVPACPLEDGVRALDVALAAREAARSGRRIALQDDAP